MKAVWTILCMIFATPTDRAHVTASQLHKAMDAALADGWEPKRDDGADSAQPTINLKSDRTQ